MILRWLLADEELERDAKQKKRIIQETCVPTQPELMHNAIIDEAVDVNLVRHMFDNDAWACVMQVISVKTTQETAKQLAHFCGACKAEMISVRAAFSGFTSDVFQNSN